MSKKLHIAYDLFDLIYPVGSIYITMNEASPVTLFGYGTWERIDTGRTLISAGGGIDPVVNDNTYTGRGTYTAQTTWFPLGESGGEYDHTLNTNQIPAHTHGSKTLTGEAWNFVGQDATYGPGVSHNGIISAAGDSSYYYPTSKSNSTKGKDGIKVNATHEHTSVGGGQGHNNVQPYFAVYMWKRTA